MKDVQYLKMRLVVGLLQLGLQRFQFFGQVTLLTFVLGARLFLTARRWKLQYSRQYTNLSKSSLISSNCDSNSRICLPKVLRIAPSSSHLQYERHTRYHIKYCIPGESSGKFFLPLDQLLLKFIQLIPLLLNALSLLVQICLHFTFRLFCLNALILLAWKLFEIVFPTSCKNEHSRLSCSSSSPIWPSTFPRCLDNCLERSSSYSMHELQYERSTVPHSACWAAWRFARPTICAPSPSCLADLPVWRTFPLTSATADQEMPFQFAAFDGELPTVCKIMWWVL